MISVGYYGIFFILFTLTTGFDGPQWEYHTITNQTNLVDDGTYPGGRFGSTLVYAEDSLFLFGGRNNESNVDKVLWRYHMGNKSWEGINISIPKRHHHTMIYDSVHNTLILFGGETDDSVIMGNIWTYHINSRVLIYSFISVPPLSKHSMEWISENEFVIFGGNTSDGFSDNLFLISVNETSGQILLEDKITPDFRPSPRVGHAVDVFNGDLYLFGGESENGTLLNDLWKFDSVNRIWILLYQEMNLTESNSGLDSHPGATKNAGLFVSESEIFLFLGYGYMFGSSQPVDHTAVWQWNTSHWDLIQGKDPFYHYGYQGGVSDFSLTKIPNTTKVSIFGGENDGNSFNNFISGDFCFCGSGECEMNNVFRCAECSGDTYGDLCEYNCSSCSNSSLCTRNGCEEMTMSTTSVFSSTEESTTTITLGPSEETTSTDTPSSDEETTSVFSSTEETSSINSVFSLTEETTSMTSPTDDTTTTQEPTKQEEVTDDITTDTTIYDSVIINTSQITIGGNTTVNGDLDVVGSVITVEDILQINGDLNVDSGSSLVFSDSSVTIKVSNCTYLNGDIDITFDKSERTVQLIETKCLEAESGILNNPSECENGYSEEYTYEDNSLMVTFSTCLEPVYIIVILIAVVLLIVLGVCIIMLTPLKKIIFPYRRTVPDKERHQSDQVRDRVKTMDQELAELQTKTDRLKKEVDQLS